MEVLLVPPQVIGKEDYFRMSTCAVTQVTIQFSVTSPSPYSKILDGTTQTTPKLVTLLLGKNQGCPFVEQRCNERASPYNCDLTRLINDEGCSWDLRKKSRCDLGNYDTDLDPWYQYYSDPTLGGNDDLADYCGLLTYDSSYRGDCTVTQYSDPGDDYYETDSYGEHYCPNCRCLTVNSDARGAPGPSCHNITCDAQGGMYVKIGYIWYSCVPGTQISITSGFSGTYDCPKREICNDIPTDSGTWPVFTTVDPLHGKVGSTITVTANNFGSNPQIVLGEYYGCNDVTVTGNTLSCVIGIRSDAPRLRGDQKVDIVVVDQDTGHTGFGEKAFTVNSSNVLIVGNMIVLSALFVLMLL